jgi:hypothetical protein
MPVTLPVTHLCPSSQRIILSISCSPWDTSPGWLLAVSATATWNAALLSCHTLWRCM